MSKVDELREKYPQITLATFNKFTEADKTQTKKYLEFLLKTWISRNDNNCPPTTNALIGLVNKFDELLPYIPNKDIYVKEYSDISYLKLVIFRAEEAKEEKTFIRNEHVFVLEENDEYILLQPLTHRGSLKYGAQTRWCTAARGESQSFVRYTKNGLLVYLIDKKGTIQQPYKKIAFHVSYSNDVMCEGFDIYCSTDNQVRADNLYNNGWSEDTILKVTTLYKILFLREKKLKKSKDFVQSFSETLSKLDFETLIEHLNVLEQTRNIDYNSTIQEKINKLVKNLNNANYAGFTKTKS